jgi:hypothetical protein
MFSFASLLFFAFTGITLNHTSWIEHQQKSEQVAGNLTLAWVHTDTSRVNELKVVEHFRSNYAIQVPLSDFITDETECSVSFKGPGYSADGIIDRSSGHYELIITKSGAIAIMNDLHKGRDAGTTWALLIDISAVIMILVSLTGFLMIFFLKKKRFNGLILTALGAIVIVLVYWMFV